ncbi:hypothetical protein BD770DRAFT_394895 [Pilaira anomala]|nr:hypothetical protein BD770DRAFT_394895 [Pilaira anomala]
MGTEKKLNVSIHPSFFSLLPFYFSMETMTKPLISFNHLFVKNQYAIISNEQPNHSSFDQLPNEIIIHILSQPVIDLSTLGNILELSPRMKHLALHVLNQYRLPSLQVSLQIDQEGKNRVTSRFQLDRFDSATLNVSMSCTNKRSRRYYNSRASPLIRTITIKDTYCLQQLSDPTAIVDDDCASFNSKEDAAVVATQMTKEPVEGDTTNGGKVNRKISTKKEGLHILHVIHNASKSKTSAFWRFAYQITQKQGDEYHLSPTHLIIPLNQLILLNKKHDKKRNTVVDWVRNCL